MSYIAAAFGPNGFGNYQVAWTTHGPEFTPVNRAADVTLIPGFVDIHIHGAFGIDFMEATASDMSALCAGLRRVGYEAFLPTTVTASADSVKRALDNLPDDPLIAGFHLEGPFISPEFPGAQPPEFIVPDPVVLDDAWNEILNDPRLRVITLAPERTGCLELTTRLSDRGVIVSMGHTNATFDQARFGFEFGARHTTHTFNAMRGLHHREAGTVGYALYNDSISCELIYDRHHVSKDAARILLKNKPKDKVIAVSDSSKATGLPPNQRITMWGHRAETLRGKVVLEGTETLAGSCITLLDAFQNLSEDFGIEVAIQLCCINPRKALKMEGTPRLYCELDARNEIVGLRTIA